VYGLGLYIADYPEQALLACIVQNWCPKYVSGTNDLDGGMYGHRSQEHTDILVEVFELGVLWDKYGIVGDIVVCIIPLSQSHMFYLPSSMISTIGLSAYTRD
jgi:hypothetical protein